jgi:hypothetical protein
MRNEVVKQRPTWRTTIAATISGLAVLAAATGALAHDDGDRGWKHRGRYFVPPGHVYYAPPAYYAPPVYYAPRPMVVYPAPVYYEPTPTYYPPPGLTINIPLR